LNRLLAERQESTELGHAHWEDGPCEAAD
jgi:hypothetical protein